MAFSSFKPIRTIVSGLFLLTTFFCALRIAPAQTVDSLLTNPDKYNGSTVTVRGAVSNLKSQTSKKGNQYYTFLLCGTDCVHVFAWGRPTIPDSDKLASVTGTFSATKVVSGYTFRNEIEADVVK